jgi:hypothetical protein
MRWGAAVSFEEQTGQSDEIHSPDEWASRVVRLISPLGSMLVVFKVKPEEMGRG